MNNLGASVEQLPTTPNSGMDFKLHDDIMPNLAETESRLQSFKQKIARIAAGEGVGTVLEGALIAGGVALPVREIAGTGVDWITYKPDAVEGVEAGEAPTRLRRVGQAVGILALNVVSGYALQKGVPALFNLVNDHMHNGLAETASQVVGKAGVMSGASTLMNRRFKS